MGFSSRWIMDLAPHPRTYLFPLIPFDGIRAVRFSSLSASGNVLLLSIGITRMPMSILLLSSSSPLPRRHRSSISPPSPNDLHARIWARRLWRAQTVFALLYCYFAAGAALQVSATFFTELTVSCCWPAALEDAPDAGADDPLVLLALLELWSALAELLATAGCCDSTLYFHFLSDEAAQLRSCRRPACTSFRNCPSAHIRHPCRCPG